MYRDSKSSVIAVPERMGRKDKDVLSFPDSYVCASSWTSKCGMRKNFIDLQKNHSETRQVNVIT